MEQPCTSPDGRRICVMRSAESDPRVPPFDLLAADVYTYRRTWLEKECASTFVATSPWSGWVYYVSRDYDLKRVNVGTLHKEIIWPKWPFPPEFMLQTVSADHRYLGGCQYTNEFTSQLVRVDLRERTWKVLLTSKEALSHLQFSPTVGNNDILVQVNRRQSYNHMWEFRAVENEFPGTTHFICDVDGGNLRWLAIGQPHTLSSSGHAAWIANTGRIAIPTHFDGKTCRPEPQFKGNLFIVGPGDAKPRVIVAPEHVFNHISVSKCGRFWVCDSYGKGVPGPIAIVVGSVKTGKYRNLLSDCKASGGGPASSHPHAYFTADNKHVIYNADPYWIGQVFSATVPEGFLESLD
jgi:hypothetical protein